MRAKTVNENIKFQRGQDPRDAMGIGEMHIRIIDKVDKFLSSFGFSGAEEDPIYNLDEIAEWQDKNSEIFIVLYYVDKTKAYFYRTEKYEETEEGFEHLTEEYQGPVDELLQPGVFQNILDGKNKFHKPIIESVNFKRGQDPKAAMSIGRDRNNYFYGIDALPLKDLIEIHGEWPMGQASEILKLTADLYGIPEDEVMAALSYKDEYETTTQIENRMEDHHWTYDDDTSTETGDFNIFKVSSGETYVTNPDENIPYMLLGPQF